MANVRISQLPTAPSAITGAELIPIVQNGQTVQTTVSAIINSPVQTQTFLTKNNEPTLPNSSYLALGTGLGFSGGAAQSSYQIYLNGTSGSLELASTGIIVKTSAGNISARSLVVTGSGLSLSNGSGVSGNPTLALSGLPALLSTTSGTGLLATAGGTSLTPLTITGTSGQITVTSGDGSAGNPNIAITATGVTSGTYGNASTIPVFTVNSQGQITSISTQAINAPTYQGTWNANTNSPTLVSSVGTQGYYYVVATAGNTNLNGYTGWNVGDWAIFSNGTWEKIPGSSTESFTNLVTTNLQVGGLTGYMYANNTSGNVTASTTIPTTALSGTITNAQLANSTISGVSLGSALYSLTIGSGLSGISYNGSSAVTIANASPMTYPSVGIANSTGSSWGTSYSTTGSGNVVLSVSPTLTTPALGTPTSITLTSGTGLPLTTGVTGVLPIANGGTNSSATATAGGAAYGNGTALLFTPVGTAGTFLQSNGAGAPVWSAISTAAGTIGISNNSTNATYYPLFYTAATGTATTEYTSASNYTFNPSTGTLSVTALLENSYAIVSQKDIGTNPNQIPLNQYLGTMAYEDKASVAITGGTVYNLTGLTTSVDASIHGLTVGLGVGSLTYNTAIGINALAGANSGTNQNTAVGYNALNINTSGSLNTAVGVNSLATNSIGASNSAFGAGALAANASGNYNVAVGYAALVNNTASNNTAIGYQAGYNITTSANNVAIGYRALYSLTNPTLTNTAIGAQAGYSTNTGVWNTFIGDSSGYSNTTGSYNNYVGFSAGYTGTIASNNNAFGWQALYYNTATYNNAFGHQALQANTTGQGNVGFGHAALYANSTGGNNTAFGYRAGTNTTGSSNIFIGAGSGSAATTGSYNVVIGSYDGTAAPISLTGSNYIVLSDGAGTVRQYIDGNGQTVFGATTRTAGYTVTTLPTGVTGMRAYVTNALAPVFGSTVVTGGAVTVPVFYNGTNWIVG